jgi:DeoR/GlpR family transcriptional regulator of sugar metabolism
MHARQRQEQILGHLDSGDFLRVEEAAARFGASPATIRRDFCALARTGAVERTHGGVRRRERRDGENLPFGLREVRHSAEKSALARHAAALLRPGDVILVDGGTSTFHLCEHLPAFKLRIITNSLRLAAGLDEERLAKSEWEVLLVGGNLYPDSGLLIGPQACANLAQYHAHWAFLSAGGVCADGVYNTNEFVAECERAMAGNADRVVLLADHSKIGRKAMCRVCGLDAVTILITNPRPETREELDQIRDAGVKVHLAGE